MKAIHALAASALVVSGSPAPAKDKPPISLARQGKWAVDYDQDSCHLLGQFGTGKQEVILKLTRYQPSTSFDLTLIGDQFRYYDLKAPLGIGFAPVSSAKRQEGMAGASAAKVPLVIFNSLRIDGWTYKQGVEAPAITPEQEAAIQAIEVVRTGKTYRLETGSMGKPMAAMRACLDDLVKHWGYDPAVQAALSRPPTPKESPGRWLQSGDYPLNSMWQGHNGLVQFRLDIAPSGQVSGCRVLYCTNPDEFADLTCKLLSKRGKFDPALDAAGQPVNAYYIGKVR